MKDREQLNKLRKELQQITKKDDDYRQTEAFKRLTAEERHEHESIFWQVEAGEIDAQIGELETKIFLKKLAKHGIPVPGRHDIITSDKYWDNNFYGEHRQLSQEAYYELNKKLLEVKKAKRDERLFWVPLVSVLVAFISLVPASYTILNYQLNENVIVAEIGVNIDNGANVLIFKNYGKLPGSQFYLSGRQIEFSDKPNELNVFSAGADYIYTNEDMFFPPKIVSANSDKHAQFLLLVWNYNNGRKSIVKSRVFVRTPSEPYWVPTTRPLVDSGQWAEILQRVDDMKRHLPRLTRDEQTYEK